MKAYKDAQGNVRLFRPDMNMDRFAASCDVLALPVVPQNELLGALKKLVKLEQRWIPAQHGYSLYLRPTMIGTQEFLGVAPSTRAMLFIIAGPVGPYYRTGFNAVKLWAQTERVRAWPGGVGDCKVGGNYAPTVKAQQEAAKQGYQQNLWLFGSDHELTEVGTMNLFVYWKNKQGEVELITPPLDGMILPGVTRDSILALTREWNEFKVTEGKVTMSEVTQAVQEGRMMEMFGAGTACIVSPVNGIRYMDKDIAIPLDPLDGNKQAGPLASRLNDLLLKIQYGQVESEWSVVV
jgi:branched-chain amino acid aminotransferase